MNAQAILEKIREDSRDAAQKIVTEARERTGEISSASQVKIGTMRAATVSQAEKDSVELEQRMLRMADLDNRKELLQKKRDIVDEAFALVWSKLQDMPRQEKRAYFLNWAVNAAQGAEEVVVGAKNDAWFNAGFVDEVNQALEKTGKPALAAKGARRPGCTGLVLVAEGVETHCTFETLLETMRPRLETQVAAELFG